MKFRIMREPGPSAQIRAKETGAYASPKKVGEIEAPNQTTALYWFLVNTYPDGHRQFGGYEFQWRGTNSFASRWRADDGRRDVRSREWSALVVLRNGHYSHNVRFYAWQ